MESFTELNLSPEVQRAVDDLGFEEPSPIQAQTIPPLLEGRDVIAQAMTGTGKTAAFGIPLVERLDPQRLAVQGIVLAPTRELAVQVADQLFRLGKHRGVRVLPIYGGQPIDRQLRALRSGVQIVVATPGRLMDHMRRGSIDLSGVRIVVLDEADEMLAMGFIEDIQTVLAALPEDRQTALFSATMPDPIRRLAGRYLRQPLTVEMGQPRGVAVPAIEQRYYEVPGRHKFEALVRVLDLAQPDLGIVFCATKRGVDEVADGLRARGYGVEALHGDMNQVQRDRAIRTVRDGRAELLVATDVAARGLDVEGVTHVINFDLPQDPEYYVHRIGRTGRAGRSGEAVTFVTPWEMREFREIERITGARIRRAEIPTAAEVADREREALAQRLLAAMGGGAWGPYRSLVEELAEEHDLLDLAAAAIGLAERERAGDGARTESPAAVELEQWLRRPRPTGPPRPPGRGRPPKRPIPQGQHRYKQQRRP